MNDPARRQQAADELAKMGGDAAPALIEVLRSTTPNLSVLAEGMLVRLGREALPALIQTLQQAHPLDRVQAAHVLGRIKDASALPALLSALRGEYFTVRAAAASALGGLGDKRALDPLLAALKDPEPVVRAAAVQAVGSFAMPDTFDAIGSFLLDDPKTEVRQAAARSLGGTRNPAALPLLMEALHDSFWWYEREPAAADLLRAIAAIGEPAIDPLIEALGDTEGTIRRFAAGLLGELHAVRAVETLGMALYDLHNEVGRAAALALGHIGVESLDVLEPATRHAEADIRQNAAAGLGCIDHPHSAELLLQLLNDPEDIVRMQVVPGLAAQTDSRAIAALMQLAGDRSDRALQSLAQETLRNMNLDA